MKTISKFHRVGLVRNLFTLRERFFHEIVATKNPDLPHSFRINAETHRMPC